MSRRPAYDVPVMILLAVGALCTSAQTAQRYLFAPRLTARPDSDCPAGDDLCFVSYAGHDSIKIDGGVPRALPAGAQVQIYEIGDDYHVRLADAGPPWQVWLLAALGLAYLGLLAYRVHRATTARRDAESQFLAGELGVLSWALGIPLIIVGALLALSPHSLTPGLLILIAGWAVLIGSFTAFLLINLKARTKP